MAKNTIKVLENDKTLMQFKTNAKQHSRQFGLKNVLTVYETIYKSCS